MVALWDGESVDPGDVFARDCVLKDGEATYNPEMCCLGFGSARGTLPPDGSAD